MHQDRWVAAFNPGGTTMRKILNSHDQLGPSANPSIPIPRSRIAPIVAISRKYRVRKYIIFSASESPLFPPPPLIDRSLLSVTLHGPRPSASRWTNQSEPEFAGNSSDCCDETMTASNGTRFAWLRARNGSSALIDGGTRNVMRTLWRIADHRRLHGSPSGE